MISFGMFVRKEKWVNYEIATFDHTHRAKSKKAKMLKLGIEPKTFALLARRSNQLSYSSTFLALFLNTKCQPLPDDKQSKQIMPPPHLTDLQRHFFSLYRRILRVHEKKLPFEMRVLGNLFVKYVSLVLCKV